MPWMLHLCGGDPQSEEGWEEKKNVGGHPKERSIELSLQRGLGFGEKTVGRKSAQGDGVASAKARGQKNLEWQIDFN